MKQESSNLMSSWIVRILLIGWAIVVLYPMVWALFASLKDNKQFYQGMPWDLPLLPLAWINFQYVWIEYKFSSFFLNSALVTVGSMVISVLLSATTAYVIARFKFKGSTFLYFLYISAMMVPVILSLIPLFFLLDELGLYDTRLGLVFVYTAYGVPFGVFVLVAFFKTLPKEMEEQASIDGASLYGTFFKIMLPLAKPGLVTVAIMNMLVIWNEYILATVLVSSPIKYTLPVGIAVMQAEMQYRTEWGPLFAGLMISMIPVILAYAFFQKQITSGMTAGAVK